MKKLQPYISVDLGGSIIKVGLFLDESLVAKKVFHVVDSNDTKTWLAALENEICFLLQQHCESTEKLAGLALAYAGAVDCKQKRLLPSNGKYENIANWDCYRWSTQWTDNFIVDNDARLACIGEWQYGAGRGYQNLVCVTLGTGIGTSVIIGDKVLRGAHDLAGCLGGHFTVDVTAGLCNCGNIGCIESLASTSVLAAIQEKLIGRSSLNPSGSLDSLNSLKWEKLQKVNTFSEIFAKSQAGSKEFKAVEEHLFHIWGAALVNYIFAYDPECIVLSGGIMQDNGLYILDRLQQYCDLYARKSTWQQSWPASIKVLLKQGFANEAGLYGGLYLLMHGEENVTL